TGRFFGREAEQTHLLRRLADKHTRLITLVGAGGVGKTRLALEVGQGIKANFPDGVWLVGLTAIKGEAEEIKMAIGEAAALGQGAKQLTGEQVLAILRDKRLLLILDNCEGVLDELDFIPHWLNRAPGIVILATAREPLNFRVEAVVLLEGL
ncbi:MAG: AAA family ATPase, partial [Caldilineaceae bacterium]|nr:AAA family ATPase [Caldilineaceae bacterium]